MASSPLLAASLALAGLLLPTVAGARDPLVHTYSIVARDPVTGDFGVAVQSHWFQVGTVVSWAEAGVGAVATQSFVEPAYGPRGLELMRQGRSAQEALDALLAADPERDVRQVAMVDAQGRVAAWTGKRCIAAAGHQTGTSFSVQANLMDRDTVWPAMAKAFAAAPGDLADAPARGARGRGRGGRRHPRPAERGAAGGQGEAQRHAGARQGGRPAGR